MHKALGAGFFLFFGLGGGGGVGQFCFLAIGAVYNFSIDFELDGLGFRVWDGLGCPNFKPTQTFAEAL